MKHTRFFSLFVAAITSSIACSSRVIPIGDNTLPDGGSVGVDSGLDGNGQADECCEVDLVQSGCMHLGGSRATNSCAVACDFYCTTNWKLEKDARGCNAWTYSTRIPAPGEDGACRPADGGPTQDVRVDDVCPTDPSAATGKACSSEGQVCGKCTDPCQFCNQLVCSGGVWTGRELFPGACQDASADASTKACGTSTCKANEFCVAERTIGGAVLFPDDAGACPVGRHPEQVASMTICENDFRFECKPTPASCAGTIDCSCASSVCGSFRCGTAPAQTDAQIACEQLAP